MKQLAVLLLALVVLGLLYLRIGWDELGQALLAMDPVWLVWAFVLFLPQILVQGWRWQLVANRYVPIGLGRATGLALLGAVANIILPSKLGDIAKGALLDTTRPDAVRLGLRLGVLEKASDLVGMTGLMVLTWLLSLGGMPSGLVELSLGLIGLTAVVAFVLIGSPWTCRRVAPLADRQGQGPSLTVLRLIGQLAATMAAFHQQPFRLVLIIGASVLLWSLHLIQFCLIAVALGLEHPALLVWSRVPMAILVGLVPVTFAGIGTRDAAMVWLFGQHGVGQADAAALGLFATVRYIVVALAGLPFLWSSGLDAPAIKNLLAGLRRQAATGPEV